MCTLHARQHHARRSRHMAVRNRTWALGLGRCCSGQLRSTPSRCGVEALESFTGSQAKCGIETPRPCLPRLLHRWQRCSLSLLESLFGTASAAKKQNPTPGHRQSSSRGGDMSILAAKTTDEVAKALHASYSVS